VIRVLAFASLLRGFTNIGLTMYRRDMQFGRIALIGLGQQLIGFFTTVILAVLLRSYWAVILGEFAFYTSGLILSYLYHSYRPRFCVTQFRQQWEFCKWIMARNLAGFMMGRGDQFVVAKFFGIENIGFYSMAIRFAEMPTKHVMAPMLMPVYAALAKQQEDPARFSRAVLQVISATSTVALPIATLFATLSGEFVGVVLGPKWDAAVPLVAPMIYTLMVGVLADPAVTTLTLRGQVRLLAVLHWFSAGSVVVVMLAVAQWSDLESLANARAALALALLLLN
jgi:O-antigen/teichoic acid export membrane protein